MSKGCTYRCLCGWPTSFHRGTLGVNMFFVLSGLLLTHSQLHDFPAPAWPKGRYYRTFLVKRLARIYPVYAAGLGVAALAAIITQNQPPAFWLLLGLNLSLTHAWLPALSMEWIGGGSWSVAVEMFFYLLFPLLLPLLLRIRRQRALLAVLGALWLASCAPGLFFAKHPALPLFRWVYAFPPARLPEFASGMIAGLLVFQRGWRVPAGAAAAAWAVAAAYLSLTGPRFEGYVAHNVLVLPALVLTVMYLARPTDGPGARLLASSPLNYLGCISYGFYIWQLVFFIICDVLWGRHVLGKYPPFGGLIVVGAILIGSIISYHVLEKPARRAILRRLRPSTPPVPARV